jgi:hypothetical protein
MGFAFNEFMTKTDFEDTYTTSERDKMLVKYLVVEDDEAEFYSQFMTRATPETSAKATSVTFKTAVADRKQMCCDEFDYSSYGFTANINLKRSNVVYFSVPYEEGGWSATVNGVDAEVLKVTYGFVGVVCPEGESEIVFKYDTPGFIVPCKMTVGGIDFEMPGGVWLSLIGLFLFAIYMVYYKVIRKHKAEKNFFSFDFYDDCGYYPEDEKVLAEALIEAPTENEE